MRSRSTSVRRAMATAAALALLATVLVPPASATDTGTGRSHGPPLAVTAHVAAGGRPWDLAFTPDGTLLFTLKSGPIMARVGTEVVEMADPADVLVSGEGGMMGLAVDPGFATNRRIYTCALTGGPTRSPDVRVIRWVVAPDYRSLGERTDIVTGIEVNTQGSLGRHSGCRLRFGPDGRLWIGTGDAAMPRTAQDPESLAGKVLRVDTDGEGVPGNAGEPFRPEIFSYGHRNVQGIAFRPGDGTPYSVEHGTHRDDEVNALVAGGNYGWHPFDPGDPTRYDESRPMTDLVRFPDAIPAVWTSGDPTIAPSGATFVSGPQWRGWDGALVLAVLKGRRLLALTLDEAGTAVVEAEARVEDRGRLRSVVQGTDGDLFVTQDADPGSVLRVAPPRLCAIEGDEPFPDVPAASPFCPSIAWAVAEGIAAGFGDGRFRPTAPVTRQASARLLQAFGRGDDPPGTAPFPDVPPSHPAHGPIHWLADAGIAAGYPDGTFRPTAPVSRQVFAALLHRLAGAPEVDDSAVTGFSDVPPGHPFHDPIAWLVGAGVADGYGDGTFGPTRTVSRQAAVAFLERGRDLRPPG